MNKLYCIKTPSGFLIKNTVSANKKTCWEIAYYKHLYKRLCHSNNPTKAAYSAGYRCVEVDIKEINSKAV